MTACRRGIQLGNTESIVTLVNSINLEDCHV